ncbi:MAG: RNA polymerase sporulation sigma factor SigK [Clostridiales bacterium]|nr:RNA polymerase sporulation sigma factor SigK [Clostridiales bacterium]
MPLFELLARLLDGAWLLLSHITGHSSFPRPLGREQEAAAMRAMLAGDTAARQSLIEHNLRLVAHIAKKYAYTGLDADDLVSIGSIGLIKAVNSFKPESGKLATYASRCIENEILMVLRANRKFKGTQSLNDPIGSDRDGNEITLADILGTEGDVVLDTAQLRIDAARAIALLDAVLDERERMVILLRYALIDGVPHPQHEVARVLGISRSYVSRIEKRAIQKLTGALVDGRPGGECR